MNREQHIFRVTALGMLGNALLLAFKFVAGILGHSAAMVADAVHSLSDFATDIVVLLFVKISGKPQDSSHAYGHGKYEALATLFIACALLAVAVGIIVAGAVKFADWLGGARLEAPGKLALWAALISIAVKELLYRYTVKWGRDLHSEAVIANAWHHRSDALSSIGTTIGIGGAILLGERWAVLDPLASLFVGGLLIKVAYDLLKNSIGELTDHTLPQDSVEKIKSIIRSFPDVSDPHHLRTRHIGSRAVIEVHIRMDGNLSLTQAHARANDIERELRSQFGEDTLVTIHIEPQKQDEA